MYVVGCSRGWEHSAKVLFERESLFRDIKKGRKKGEVTPTLSASGTGTSRVGFNCEDEWFIPTFWNGSQVADTLTCTSNEQRMPDKNKLQAVISLQDTSGRDKAQNGKGWSEGASYTLDATGLQGVVAPTLTTNNSSRSPQSSEVTQQINAVYQSSMAVRRLTPTECERLQGFPDGYTDIMPNGKQTPDGPRYKALGNSMAVPVMKWIGERINNYE